LVLKFNDILNDFELTYKPFGERSILIEWPNNISEEVLGNVLFHKDKLENFSFEEKVYIKHGYNSILITYDIGIDNFYDEISTLKSLEIDNKSNSKSTYKLWKIPVCYDLEFGIDLQELSHENGLNISEIIQLHIKTKYTIYFLGFLPGFLYLGGLNKKLHFPRKKSPRLKIDKGSVAIGGSQTGIYPNESPGGWNIIGKTPLNLFDAKHQNPCFADAGDKIQFVSITKNEYSEILCKVENDEYNCESEVING